MPTFKNTAIDEFDFLCKEYGFQIASIDDNRIMWCNGPYVVELTYNTYSYEIGIHFYLSDKNGKSPSYSLDEILACTKGNTGAKTFQASSDERMQTIIKKMAKLFYVACHDFNLFSLKAFDSLRKIRDLQCEKYAIKNDLIKMREQAQQAWQDRNYKKIVLIYSKYEKYLSPSEKKKYEYAKSHC